MNVKPVVIARLMELAVLDGQSPNLQDISERVGYSLASWDNQFAREMNVNPGAHIRLFRLRCICMDLRNTGLKICDICNDYSRAQPQLTRLFKQKFGMTPVEFRNAGDIKAREAMDRVFMGTRFTHSFDTIPPTPLDISQ